MADELRLRALHPIPPIGFIYRRLTFDMSAIRDDDFKARLAQIIDAGFTSPAPSLREEVAALEGTGNRSIHFFSDEATLTAGSKICSTKTENPTCGNL